MGRKFCTYVIRVSDAVRSDWISSAEGHLRGEARPHEPGRPPRAGAVSIGCRNLKSNPSPSAATPPGEPARSPAGVAGHFPMLLLAGWLSDIRTAAAWDWSAPPILRVPLARCCPLRCAMPDCHYVPAGAGQLRCGWGQEGERIFAIRCFPMRQRGCARKGKTGSLWSRRRARADGVGGGVCAPRPRSPVSACVYAPSHRSRGLDGPTATIGGAQAPQAQTLLTR